VADVAIVGRVAGGGLMSNGAQPRGALVLGGDYRALGVVRSLGRRGVPVWVVRQGDDSLAARSRYAQRCLPWPEHADEEQQTAALLEIAEAGAEGWALIPSADETASLVARHHERLAQRFALTTPAWETLRHACDKRLTYPLAQALGVDVPLTWYPEDRAAVEALDLEFPVILKPAWKEGFNRLTAAKAWRVDSREELLRAYDDAVSLVSPTTLMIQELIPGGGEAQFSFATLARAGRPLASVVARRTRQYPPDFGRASTYVETVHCPEVVPPSLRVLDALGYTGLVELEYKRDPRNGLFKLLDINPRVWGWHTLCGRAGVDFPYLLWRALCGEDIGRVDPQVGVRWVRTTTDFPMVAKQIMRGRMSVRTYLRSLRGPLEGAIFAQDDLAPGLLEVPLLASILVQRIAHGSAV
jgi:D-aspartate ligase